MRRLIGDIGGTNARFALVDQDGLPAEVQRAADAINAVHDRVHGELRTGVGPFEAGHRYSAHDPELQRWVHHGVAYAGSLPAK